MKHTLQFALLAGLFLAVLAGPTLGEEKRDQPRVKKEGEVRKEGEKKREGDGAKAGQLRELEAMFKKFDTNGDQKLSADEVKGTKLGKAFKEFDGDGDGFITFAELRSKVTGEPRKEGERKKEGEGRKEGTAKKEGEARKVGVKREGEKRD